MNAATPETISFRAVLGDCALLTGPADVLAAADDRDWFDQRPTRAYRLRRARAGELGMSRGLIVVHSVPGAGFRLRQPLPANPGATRLLLREAHREAVCAVLWHRLAPPELVELAAKAAEVAAEFWRRRAMN